MYSSVVLSVTLPYNIFIHTTTNFQPYFVLIELRNNVKISLSK